MIISDKVSDCTKIWDKLIERQLVGDSWTENEKMFAINILKNNNKYIEEHLKDMSSKMMTIAASENTSMFIFLSERWEVDINCGLECLWAACKFNEDLDMIKYLINLTGIDINNPGEYAPDFFAIACAYNNNVEIIKYMVYDLNMLTNLLDIYGRNCLMLACMYNDLNIVKFLIHELKMNPKDHDSNNDNCLILACENEKHGFEIFNYLITLDQINPSDSNDYGDDCLIISCMHSGSVDQIQYLIGTVGLDPNRLYADNANCLISACGKNNNLHIIKYLVECIKIDISHTNNHGNNCFLAACMNSHSDDQIVKYLVNEVGMDVNYKNHYDHTALCLTYNKKIIKFLVNETNITFNDVVKCDITQLAHIIKSVDNCDKLNHVIDIAIKMYPVAKISEIVKETNPFKLTQSHRKIFDIKPFDQTYEKCVELINQLCEPVQIPDHNLSQKQREIGILYDFSIQSEPLFKHGDQIYHGQRDVVYSQILLLNDIHDIMNLKDLIVLEGNLPKNVINQYITSSYTGFLSFESIEPEHWINFLKFIDQYPTINVQIDKIQIEIIDYMAKHNLDYDPYLVDLCQKYQLKYIYLDMHNKKLKNK